MTLIVLIGPTGVGKTELSLSIAETYHTSILSADSRQLYADLKIGTAAPTPQPTGTGSSLFCRHITTHRYYSAAQYESRCAQKNWTNFLKAHDVVVLTGGSMMYVDAVCKGIDDIPTVDAETRQLMIERYEQEGLEQLCAELKVLDPEYYAIVDRKKPQTGHPCSRNLLYDRKDLHIFSHPDVQETPLQHRENRFKHVTGKNFTNASTTV